MFGKSSSIFKYRSIAFSVRLYGNGRRPLEATQTIFGYRTHPSVIGCSTRSPSPGIVFPSRRCIDFRFIRIYNSLMIYLLQQSLPSQPFPPSVSLVGHRIFRCDGFYRNINRRRFIYIYIGTVVRIIVRIIRYKLHARFSGLLFPSLSVYGFFFFFFHEGARYKDCRSRWIRAQQNGGGYYTFIRRHNTVQHTHAHCYIIIIVIPRDRVN